ncbi:MoxR family ATPase [Humibacter sp. RRB41]|uniref:AAA family ATPase n=1 Tax=Humibacter sp. RRB41 TaxID=2919946 RepID=UPI001FAB1BBA|nr:MoxR family ATPase [Humibacter sp. RRB41]
MTDAPTATGQKPIVPLTDDQASWFASMVDAIVQNVEHVLLGKTHVIRLAVTALLSEGHLLLEDVPGTGKTSLARALAESISGTSSRIQFTPDLLPGDITGVGVYDQRSGEFVFHKGPVFANVVLADEINRASPKTQSALLEVMEERQVSVDGVTHRLAPPFMVIATQNPIEQAGTYRLPEAQLDRFIMKASIGYPDHASMVRILEGADHAAHEMVLPTVVMGEMVTTLSRLARAVHVEPAINDYVSRLVDATRNADEVRLGVSVRGGLALIRTAKTYAAGLGRSYVIPDDVKALAEPVLAHRLVLDTEAEFDGVTAHGVIANVILQTPPPQDGTMV